MPEIGSTYEIVVTKIIDEHRAVTAEWVGPGQTDMPIVATNKFYCSVDGAGRYLGEVVNEILHVGDIRQAEYRIDGIFHVLQHECGDVGTQL